LQFTRIGPPGTYSHLMFTPDGKHLLWTVPVYRVGGSHEEVICDGRPAFGPYFSVTHTGTGVADPAWEMQPDGTLLFVAQLDNAMKRISLTPSSDTSWTALFGAH
jgi:hypothetical protein